MIDKKKLKFYFDKEYNVLMSGKHGVGKTSAILQVFEEAGLQLGETCLYFSGSTMDPFIDFCGVPLKIEEDNQTKIRLILPEHINANKVKAIFIDEYNRCLTGDTKIQLASGKSVPIKDLVNEDYFYVYACDVDNGNNPVIAKGHSARLTIKDAPLLKITLDNGQTIRCTENHPILTSDKGFVLAKDLKENDSLMCLYKKYNKKGYELVCSTRSRKWVTTYILSDKYNVENNLYDENYEEKESRHHNDFNKYNNSPENIIRLTRLDHLRVHGKNTEGCSKAGKKSHRDNPGLYNRSIGTEESKIKAQKSSAQTRKTCTKYKKKRSELSKKMYTDEMVQYRSQVTKKQWENGQFENIDRQDALLKNHISRTINKFKEKGHCLTSISLQDYNDIKKDFSGKGKSVLTIGKIEEHFGSFENFKQHIASLQAEQRNLLNHRVVSIESDGTEDVYDISVDKYHNFALDCGVFVHNSHSKIRNSVMELIQFKSINGRKFPQLKVIWAAINPENEEDEEQVYNVDRIDPAQKDRFHVYMDIPYKCDKNYFRKAYSPSISDSALEWWNQLPPKTKDMVSPRRLDYALKIHSDGGDLSDALPAESNPSALKLALTIGPDGIRIQEMLNKNKEKEAKEFIRTIDGFEKFMQFIKNNPSDKNKAIKFFCLFLSDEQVSRIISEDKYSEIFNYIKSDIVNDCYLSSFSYVLLDYVKMHSTKESEELKKFLESTLGSLEEMKIEIHKSIPVGVTDESFLVMPRQYYFTTQDKYKLYCDLKGAIRREITDEGLEKTMRILNKCIGGSRLPTIKKKYSDAHIYLEYVLSHVALKRLNRKKASALFKDFNQIDESKKLEFGWTRKHEELLKKYV